MSRLSHFLFFGSLVVAVAVVPRSFAVEAAEAETIEVQVEEITLIVPASWEKQKPSNNLRLAQFGVPAAEGVLDSTELSVFHLPGGSVAQLVQRWKGQFQLQGQRFRAVQGDSPLGEYVFADVAGTYRKPDGPPILRQTKDAPGYRMLIARIDVEEQGNYFIKLVGPESTVAANIDAFRQLFGANADAEKELD